MGHMLSFPKYDVISVPDDYFTLTNSVHPDEMQHYAAFHLSLHCLPKYHLGVSSINGLKIFEDSDQSQYIY